MFDLNRREIIIFVVLIALLLTGYGVGMYKRSHPAMSVEIKRFDVPREEARSSEGAPQSIININTASAEELMRLKGVGKVLAERIVEYRLAHGPFYFVEDIKKVKGVGEKLFGRIKDSIVTE